jgi:hypothetical protein
MGKITSHPTAAFHSSLVELEDCNILELAQLVVSAVEVALSITPTLALAAEEDILAAVEELVLHQAAVEVRSTPELIK